MAMVDGFIDSPSPPDCCIDSYCKYSLAMSLGTWWPRVLYVERWFLLEKVRKRTWLYVYNRWLPEPDDKADTCSQLYIYICIIWCNISVLCRGTQGRGRYNDINAKFNCTRQCSRRTQIVSGCLLGSIICSYFSTPSFCLAMYELKRGKSRYFLVWFTHIMCVYAIGNVHGMFKQKIDLWRKRSNL